MRTCLRCNGEKYVERNGGEPGKDLCKECHGQGFLEGMEIINLILSGNPLSTQHIYRSVFRGKFPTVYMTKQGKNLEEQYRSEATNQYHGKVLTGDVEMGIFLFFQDKRRRDVDNYNKLVLDSLEGIIFEDDKQIQKLTIVKGYSKENPRVEVNIYY